jgi:hypothetical protein
MNILWSYNYFLILRSRNILFIIGSLLFLSSGFYLIRSSIVFTFKLINIQGVDLELSIIVDLVSV